MKKIFLVIIVFSLSCLHVFANETTDMLRRIQNYEASWIIAHQVPSGAYIIATPGYDGKGKIIPYFSNFAAQSLLDTNASKYRESVKKYILWYFNHLNTNDIDGLNATVYDYDYDQPTNTETATKKYDSVDSYASTFITLLWKYYDTTGDRSFFMQPQIKDNIPLIIENMNTNTRESNSGLSFATKSYHIAYTMDNIESYK